MSLPSFSLRSAYFALLCSALRCVARSEGHKSGAGQTGLGLDSGRFSFFFFFFFDRLFASLLVLRSAHDGFGGSHCSAFFIYPFFASARSFPLSTASFLLPCSEIARTLSRRNPQIFVVALVQLAILANFIRLNPLTSLVYGINLTPLVGRKSMDAAFAKQKHTTFKTNILSPSHAKNS